MHWRGTVSLGSPIGIEVRLHWLLLLFGAGALLGPLVSDEGSFYWAAAGVLSLFIAVVLREWAHCSLARRLGLEVDEVILGPFGSLDEVASARVPIEQRLIALAGPAVHLIVIILLGAYVVATHQVNSFLFRFDSAGGPPDVIAIFWGVHLDLFLLHLLPSYPFDGGRVLHSLIWDRSDEDVALSKVVLSSRFCAVGCLIAWLFLTHHSGELLFIGILCFVSGEMERRRFEARANGPDWLAGEREPTVGPMGRWWRHRNEVKEAQGRESAARERIAEEATLDALLEKVHTEGLEALSRSERKFLSRVGKKYRNRDDPS